MPDIITISTFLTSLKTATDIAKAIRSADISLEKAETKLKIAELLESLADAKLQAIDIQELLTKKDQRIAELESALDFKKKLVRYADAYYEADSNGKPTGDPFCTRCWEVDHRAIHVTELNASEVKCSACGSVYKGRRVPYL